MSAVKLICIDSDGCAIDSMNIKHELAFAACLIDVFGLKDQEDTVRAIWYKYNLFSSSRGQNRFLTLSSTLHELEKKGIFHMDITPLDSWIKRSAALSNVSLEKAACNEQDGSILQLAYEWSLDVNRHIAMIPEELVKPFDNVADAMAALPEDVSVDIISSANAAAVSHEWEKFGLLRYVTRLFSQDDGSKADCIRMCIEGGLSPDSVIMCGDSPGDLDAARKNSCFFFPILVKREGESWKMFIDEIIPHLDDVSWLKASQERYIRLFSENLGMEV